MRKIRVRLSLLHEGLNIFGVIFYSGISIGNYTIGRKNNVI